VRDVLFISAFALLMGSRGHTADGHFASWTIYGTSKGGMEDTLEEGEQKFKIEYEKLR
jgi:hypothetical protein